MIDFLTFNVLDIIIIYPQYVYNRPSTNGEEKNAGNVFVS